MMRRLAAVVFWLVLVVPVPVQAGCLIFCDNTGMNATDARAYLEAELAAPLPEGVEVLVMLEGGFQDTFIEVELAGPPDAISAMLRMLAIDPGTLEPVQAAEFGAAAAPVWSLRPDMALHGAEGRLGHFAYARVAVTRVPDAAGHLRLYLFAFET